MVSGEEDRVAYPDYFEEKRTDRRPKSLRERLAVGRAFDN